MACRDNHKEDTAMVLDDIEMLDADHAADLDPDVLDDIRAGHGDERPY
jgi:hypothetical protein